MEEWNCKHKQKLNIKEVAYENAKKNENLLGPITGGFLNIPHITEEPATSVVNHIDLRHTGCKDRCRLIISFHCQSKKERETRISLINWQKLQCDSDKRIKHVQRT